MKKKWFEVYIGNNDVFKGYRTILDLLWFDNPFSAFERYHLADGSVVRVSKHFTVKVVELR